MLCIQTDSCFMKFYSLILAFTIVFSSTTYSQTESDIWQVIEYEELKDFSLNSKISLYKIINLEENWDQLRSLLGEPTKEITRERPDDLGLKPTWVFHYTDMKIRYSDDYTDGEKSIEFAVTTITGPDAFLEYKGKRITVNQSIEILEEIFPVAFSKRHDIPYDDTGDFLIQLNVDRRNVGISFRYHPKDNTIKEIEFYQIYT